MALEDFSAHGPRGPATLPRDKAVLRVAMRAARRAYVDGLSLDERAAQATALAGIVQPRLPASAIVGAYAAHGGEIDPQQIAPSAALPWFADAMSECVFRLGPGTERGRSACASRARAARSWSRR